jgi:hypothetical protein
VEDPIGQAAHLGMTAFTRVFAQSPGKGDDLLERPHDGVVENMPTAVALGQARENAPRRLQLTASAPGQTISSALDALGDPTLGGLISR